MHGHLCESCPCLSNANQHDHDHGWFKLCSLSLDHCCSAGPWTIIKHGFAPAYVSEQTTLNRWRPCLYVYNQQCCPSAPSWCGNPPGELWPSMVCNILKLLSHRVPHKYQQLSNRHPPHGIPILWLLYVKVWRASHKNTIVSNDSADQTIYGRHKRLFNWVLQHKALSSCIQQQRYILCNRLV